MKKYIFSLLTLCCAATSLSAAATLLPHLDASAPTPTEYAQRTPDRRADAPRKERLNRRQLAELQAKRTAQKLNLDDKTTAKYVKTYCEMMEEIWQLAPRNEQFSTTDEQAKKAIEQRFARSQKILQIREKYYKIYSTFLSPQQIQQAYRIERKDIIRLAAQRRHKRGAQQPQ
ncbi:MAG: hypothetical protein HXL30_01060 [Prevotellaceae bacterium]|jgi:hypothetical protein|nr:hypothetical protein [Prevotellaceae bacterium]